MGHIISTFCVPDCSKSELIKIIQTKQNNDWAECPCDETWGQKSGDYHFVERPFFNLDEVENEFHRIADSGSPICVFQIINKKLNAKAQRLSERIDEQVNALNKFPALFALKVRESGKEFYTCPCCKAKIQSDRVRTSNCPHCFRFLWSATDKTKYKKLEAKLAETKAKFKTEVLTLQKIESKQWVAMCDTHA